MMDDDAREIILSRRTALIAAALAGVGMAVTCDAEVEEPEPKACLSQSTGSGGAQPCLGMAAGGGGTGGAGGARACLGVPAGGAGGARACL